MTNIIKTDYEVQENQLLSNDLDILALNIKLANSALISTDNNQSFENEQLGEFYVQGGEIAAIGTKRAIDILKPLNVLMINVLEEHPKGHICWASSYLNKNPFDLITLDEVIDWTDEINGLSDKAKFTVGELKKYLLSKEGNRDVLRNDHSEKGTQGAELMMPLTESDFDYKVLKGTEVIKEAYSAFDGTNMDQILQDRKITSTIVTGVVTEVCVRATVLDSIKNGYKTIVLTDAIKGITQEGHIVVLNELKSAGAIITTTDRLVNLLK